MVTNERDIGGTDSFIPKIYHQVISYIRKIVGIVRNFRSNMVNHSSCRKVKIILWRVLSITPGWPVFKIKSIITSDLHWNTRIQIINGFVRNQKRNISLWLVVILMNICRLSVPFSKKSKCTLRKIVWLFLEIINLRKIWTRCENNIEIVQRKNVLMECQSKVG